MAEINYIAPVDIGKSDKPLEAGIIGDGTPVVTHDVLCACNKHPHYGPNDHLRSTCVCCDCNLIARVRAAVLDEAREAVVALPCMTGRNQDRRSRHVDDFKDAALAAIDALKETR